MQAPELLRVEFHCHTIYSKDSVTRVEDLLLACQRKGIDRVVITDHNTIRGALAAKALDPDRVIIGEEILTSEGELLAAFVQAEIPAGLTPLETIERLRKQGAFISVSHPFDIHRKGHWDPAVLQAILPLVDAIETFNARCVFSEFNERAQALADAYHLPGTVGSDAHATLELGQAMMILPAFVDQRSFRAVLPMAKYDLHLSPFWYHLFSRAAVIGKRLFPKQFALPS
jgi:hypothetical protein